MVLEKPCPFVLPLEEAEVATRSRPPAVVGRQPEPRLLEEAEDVSFGDAIFLEREHGLDVWLRGDVPVAVLIGADPNVADHRIFADVLLERLQLELPGAPPHLRGRQVVAVDLEPMVKATLRI